MKESQCPTHCKYTFILQKNFLYIHKTMTSQNRKPCQQVPEYENETKRTRNIMLETTIVKVLFGNLDLALKPSVHDHLPQTGKCYSREGSVSFEKQEKSVWRPKVRQA